MSDTNKNLVRRHFEEIWNQRKMAARDEPMADDFPEHAAAPLAATALGKVYGGHRKIAAMMRADCHQASTSTVERPAPPWAAAAAGFSG